MADTFLRPVEALVPGDHACLLFDSIDHRRNAVERFLRVGLRARQKVVFLAIDDADAAVGARLYDDATRGQVEVMLSDDAYGSGGFDPEQTLAWFASTKRRALDAGFAALRACGGIPAEACGDAQALTDYERRCEELFEDRRMVGLCGYDQRLVSESTLLGLLEAHPIATYALAGDDRLTVEVLTVNSLRVSGWIDALNAGLLATPLAQAVGHRENVTVDLSRVSFADICAVRVFAEAARAVAGFGRRLTLSSAPSPLPEVLTILGWHELEGLELV